MKTKKKIWCCLFSLLWMFVLIFPVMASEIPDIPTERQKPLLVDEAGLLSEEESSTLINKLEEISQRQKNEVAVVTVNSLEGKTAEAYADDYYDYNGYGYGENDDGLLLLVSMGERVGGHNLWLLSYRSVYRCRTGLYQQRISKETQQRRVCKGI